MPAKTLGKKVAVANVPEISELIISEVAVKIREGSNVSKKSITVIGYDEENREVAVTIPLKKAPANLEKYISLDGVATIARGGVVDVSRRFGSVDDLFGLGEEE